MSNIENMKRDEILDMARKFRDFIEKHAEILDDDTALQVPNAYPAWSGDGVEYHNGTRVRYRDELYKVITAHTSQPTWTPTDAPSLFALVLTQDDEQPEEWRQPDSTNAYMLGDVVLFEGGRYMSLIDNNVWSPADYPSGWQRVS